MFYIFHSPHFPHSTFSTLLIFHTPHFPHSALSTLRVFHRTFPVQNFVQRLRSQTPSSVSSTPNEVSAIPCELFGNILRALFLKNRDFFWYCEIFLPNTRGPLGCLLGFWPSRPKPCGGNDSCCFGTKKIS